MRDWTRNWIEQHGSSALQRALAEGYDVRKGAADEITDAVRDSLDLESYSSWEESEERTSPNSDSFALRDVVLGCVRAIEIPQTWSMDVSRISRITLLGGAKVTGVFVRIADDRGIIKSVAVSFEGETPRD